MLTARLADHALDVIAVEESPYAVRLGELNMQLNTCSNVRYRRGRVEDIVSHLDEAVDVVVLDPPRAGCAEAAVEAMANLRPNGLSTSRVTRRRWREMSIVFVPPDAIPLWRWLSSTCSPRPSTSRRSSSSNGTHELRPPSHALRIQLPRRREPYLEDGPPRGGDRNAGDRAHGSRRALRCRRSLPAGQGRRHQPDHRPGGLRRDSLAPPERRSRRPGPLPPHPARQGPNRLPEPHQAFEPGAPRRV